MFKVQTNTAIIMTQSSSIQHIDAAITAFKEQTQPLETTLIRWQNEELCFSKNLSDRITMEEEAARLVRQTELCRQIIDYLSDQEDLADRGQDSYTGASYGLLLAMNMNLELMDQDKDLFTTIPKMRTARRVLHGLRHIISHHDEYKKGIICGNITR